MKPVYIVESGGCLSFFTDKDAAESYRTWSTNYGVHTYIHKYTEHNMLLFVDNTRWWEEEENNG